MKRDHHWLTSGAFAVFCGTTKETLRHYKNMGLLSPVHRGDNGYFYYDMEQFYDFYAISIFRQTGTPLEKIRLCLQGQDVSETLSLLQEQQDRLETERKKLEQMEFVLSGAMRNLELGAVPDMVPQIAFFEQEHLLALPVEELEGVVPLTAGEDERLIVVLEQCLALCRQHGVQTDFQLGAIHSSDGQAGPGDISHLYIRVKEKADSPYYIEKPAGEYVHLCCRGKWDISEGYGVLRKYILEQNLKTTGDFYACDLAGFILNGVEKNAASMISARLCHSEK
ncbi:MAG: MerR family transcriptional regulator [Lachnospiraceae bacterium]|nr:MerR family transcriptional regulator [Lachnospiraceae bacterium]